ncbi:MAG: hypothetical protein JO247_04080, partial [Chloroflexi bacterium]|nr:hypothetical protein [Chloroflexota bacterium]
MCAAVRSHVERQVNGLIAKRYLGLLAVVPWLVPAMPAQAQTAPAPNCQFQFGLEEMAALLPDQVGSCIANKMFDASRDAMQETSHGLLSWSKTTNVVEFTNGEQTWVNSKYGLILRDGTVSYPWEDTVSLVA